MKVALWHPETGEPVRLMDLKPIDVARCLILDARYYGAHARLLDGTAFEHTMTLVALPSLDEFDVTAGDPVEISTLLPQLEDHS